LRPLRVKRIYARERIDVIFGQSLRILVVHPHAARTPRPHLALHDPPLASHLLAFVPARPRPATDSPPAPSPEQIGLRHPHRHHRILPSIARTATLFSTRNAARTPFVFFSTACPNTHTRARAHTRLVSLTRIQSRADPHPPSSRALHLHRARPSSPPSPVGSFDHTNYRRRVHRIAYLDGDARAAHGRAKAQRRAHGDHR